ncbi:MAG: hypothetical protein MUP21_03405, partial [Dehalococcoidia bacterium]|nr:hypothetical protein [Dehalococcoidia bacterium]
MEEHRGKKLFHQVHACPELDEGMPSASNTIRIAPRRPIRRGGKGQCPREQHADHHRYNNNPPLAHACSASHALNVPALARIIKRPQPPHVCFASPRPDPRSNLEDLLAHGSQDLVPVVRHHHGVLHTH